MVTCHYCNQPAELVTGKEIYPHLPNLHNSKFWRCQPCGAYVGCHRANKGYGDGTVPLGILANAYLRRAKIDVHNLLDPMWKSGAMKRMEAYAWLAKEMNISLKECHIGMFSLAQCQQAIQLLRKSAEE
jgi:hypothetical protein